MTTEPQMQDMTEQGMQQVRDGRMRLYKAISQPSGFCDGCVHGMPFEDYCEPCYLGVQVALLRDAVRLLLKVRPGSRVDWTHNDISEAAHLIEALGEEQE